MCDMLQRIVSETKPAENLYPILNSTSKSCADNVSFPFPSAPPNLTLFTVENETKGNFR